MVHQGLLPDEGVYEARYGWNRQSAKVIGGCLAFCLVAAFVPMPLWVSIPVGVFFGGGGLFLLALTFVHRPALRVDSSGITTLPRPLSPGSRRFHPWEDVTAILVWQFNGLRSVGVVRRDGAAPQPAKPLRSTTRAALAISAPGVPAEVAASAVSASGWSLDIEQLTASVTRFAPDVQVVIEKSVEPPTRRAGRAGRVTRRDYFGRRQILWACGVILSVCFMYLGGSHLGPALRAAHGQGIHGMWVAEQCVGNHGSCDWYGRFELPDGQVRLPWVSYGGNLSSVQAGTAVPALDSGASDEVYPVGGTDRWVHDVIGLAGGGVAFVLLIGRWVYVERRRRQAGHDGGPVA